MKRYRWRERRTDVGRAGLFLTALLFPQVGLKTKQMSHSDQQLRKLSGETCPDAHQAFESSQNIHAS